MTISRVNILGVGVSAIDMAMAVDIVDAWVARREANYITVTGVHGIMESQADAGVRRIHNRAGIVTPDGMPLVWLARLKGHGHVDRVYGPDLMLRVCEDSVSKGYRHYLYGGDDGVPELLKRQLENRFPGLNIVGTYSPPFRALSDEEDDKIVGHINAVEPDIVWVGLGTPKQERWMAAHVNRLTAPALIGVGAAFDFHAGLKVQAPRWVQRSGLEWLFRLVTEPRRLWRRYLRNNPLFVLMILQQALGMKRYADDWLIE